MLSPENVAKIIATGLYGHEPIDNRFTATSGNYHCKNWTFRFKEGREGRWYAIDTYFDSWDFHTIEVTDKNFDEFVFIVDLSTLKEVSSSTMQRYVTRFCLACDSGGRNYPKFFVLKDAKPSRALERMELWDKLKTAERQVSMYKEQIKRIIKDPDGYYAKYYDA